MNKKALILLILFAVCSIRFITMFNTRAVKDSFFKVSYDEERYDSQTLEKVVQEAFENHQGILNRSGETKDYALYLDTLKTMEGEVITKMKNKNQFVNPQTVRQYIKNFEDI